MKTKRAPQPTRQLYRVSWEIDIDAENEREAAKIAKEYQKDPDALVDNFQVWNEAGTTCKNINLLSPESTDRWIQEP